jgi:hypothetical protein
MKNKIIKILDKLVMWYMKNTNKLSTEKPAAKYISDENGTFLLIVNDEMLITRMQGYHMDIDNNPDRLKAHNGR